MLHSLQIGRALAAIAVAAFHLSINMGQPRYGSDAVFWEFTKRGNLGVDFFFVLSGFIILFAHQHDIGQRDRLPSYAYRRLIRVYPIYLLYTAGYVSLVLAGFGGAAVMPNSVEGWLTAFTLIYFGGGESPLSVAWTLIHEIAFYAMFGLLVLHRRIGTCLFVAWILATLLHFKHPDYDARTPIDVYFGLYNLNFLIGMLAFAIYKHANTRWFYASLAAGVTLLITGWKLESGDLVPASVFLLVYALGFGGLVAGAAGIEREGMHIPGRWLVAVGDASYTLYLLHLPILGLLLKIALKLSLDDVVGRELLYILVLVGTVVTSVVAYRLVEVTLLRSLRRWAPDISRARRLSESTRYS